MMDDLLSSIVWFIICPMSFIIRFFYEVLEIFQQMSG